MANNIDKAAIRDFYIHANILANENVTLVFIANSENTSENRIIAQATTVTGELDHYELGRL